MKKVSLFFAVALIALLLSACDGTPALNTSPAPAPQAANALKSAVEAKQPEAVPANKLAYRLGAHPSTGDKSADALPSDSAAAEATMRDATPAETAQAFEIMKAQPDVLVGDPVKKLEILVNGNAFAFGEENETFLGATDVGDRTYVTALSADGAKLHVYTVGHNGTVTVASVSGHFAGLVHASVSLNGKWILLLSQKDTTTAGVTAQLVTMDGGAGPVVNGTFAWTGTAWLDNTHFALRLPKADSDAYQAPNPNRPEIGVAENKAHWVVLGF